MNTVGVGREKQMTTSVYRSPKQGLWSRRFCFVPFFPARESNLESGCTCVWKQCAPVQVWGVGALDSRTSGRQKQKVDTSPEAISENADTGNPPEDKQISAFTVTKIRSCLRRRCLQARVELFRRRSGCFSAAAKRKQASSAMFQCAILHGRVAKASFKKNKRKNENGGARERERGRNDWIFHAVPASDLFASWLDLLASQSNQRRVVHRAYSVCDPHKRQAPFRGGHSQSTASVWPT